MDRPAKKREEVTPLPTVAVGSWPGRDLSWALAQERRFDVPALPELPELAPSELLLGQTPGTLPLALSSWLANLPLRANAGIKVQRCGPFTHSHFQGATWEIAVPRALHQARALLAALPSSVSPSQVLFFWDEPGLNVFPDPDPSPRWEEFLAECRRSFPGVRWGLHSCAGPEATLSALRGTTDALNFDLDLWSEQDWRQAHPLLQQRLRAGLLWVAGTEGPERTLRELAGLLTHLPDARMALSPRCGFAGQEPRRVEAHVSALLDAAQRLGAMRASAETAVRSGGN
jgi:hypothetical protein